MRYLLIIFCLSFYQLSMAQTSLYFSVGPEVRFQTTLPLEKVNAFIGDNITKNTGNNNGYAFGSNASIALCMGAMIPIGGRPKNQDRNTETFLQFGLGYLTGNSAFGAGYFEYVTPGDTVFSNDLSTAWRADTLFNENLNVEIRSDYLRIEMGAFVRVHPSKRVSTTFGAGIQAGYSFDSETRINSNSNSYVSYVWLYGNQPNYSDYYSNYTYTNKTLRTGAVSALSVFTAMRLEFVTGKLSKEENSQDRLYFEFRPQTTVEKYGSSFSISNSGMQLLMGFIASF